MRLQPRLDKKEPRAYGFTAFSSGLPCKTRLADTVNHDLFIEHGCGPHPQAFVAVQRPVQGQGLQGFAVARRAQHFITQAFVMKVKAGWGFYQRREGVGHGIQA